MPSAPDRPAESPSRRRGTSPEPVEAEVSEFGLEWADVSLIRRKLELSPAERLREAQELINAAARIRGRNAGLRRIGRR